MPILETILATGLPKLIEAAGGGLLARVARSGKVGEVIAEVARQAGIDATPNALQDLAKSDPTAFSNAVIAAEQADQARWEALAAESKHSSVFVAGARPAAIWACNFVILYSISALIINWLMQLVGYLAHYPNLPAMMQPTPVVWETLKWMLPLLYGLRTIEGVTGTKRSSL